VADNLPNDPRSARTEGSKKIFFKNFMDARVNYVILPLAHYMMLPDQAAKARVTVIFSARSCMRWRTDWVRHTPTGISGK